MPDFRFATEEEMSLRRQVAEYRDTIAQQAELLAAHKAEVQDWQRQLLAAQQERDEYKKDAERISYLEKMLFERKWNGVVGSGCQYSYSLVGNWRHSVSQLSGESLGEAIDAAMKEGK